MRLTTFTDYTLRTLIYLAQRPGQLATVADIASVHGISRHHLTKVVHQLGLGGLIRTVRGRQGGIMLAHAPGTVRIGQVVLASEPDFRMADCFDPLRSTCRDAGNCRLQHVLGRASAAFLTALDDTTLADLARWA